MSKNNLFVRRIKAVVNSRWWRYLAYLDPDEKYRKYINERPKPINNSYNHLLPF